MIEKPKKSLDEQEILKLMDKKSELELLIHANEEERLHLLKQIHILKEDLQDVKKRYKQEQQLKRQSQKKLDEIHKSHSWRLSLPIRKIGGLFKKFKGDEDQDNINAIKEVFEKRTSAIDLDRKLWAGYSQYALQELNDLKECADSPLNERLRSARSLARWYFDHEEYDQAYKELEYISEVKPLNHPNADRVIPQIKVLQKLGNIHRAKRKVWETIKENGPQSELCLSMAHLAEDEHEKLTWYNLLYDMYGYGKIKKTEDSKPLQLGNISTISARDNRQLDYYKVSIIIPAYNAADSIHVPLDSLLGQTMQNIEIIVVDDCSPDNTVEVVETYVKKDSRIKLIKKQKNEGAYAARNTGLQYITGDFITVHDSDDWSHSQKIEVQLKALLRNPNAVGSISFLARSTEDVTPINAGSLLNSKFLTMNSSSLLIRRSVSDQLGGWDSVRVAGDSEFIWRIEKVFGTESIIRVEPKVPFSLSLSTESSLTGASTTHVKTIMFGLRRTYREAYEWWHDQASSAEDLYLDPQKINRTFPCPVPNKMIKPKSRYYDDVFIADFSNDSDVSQLVNTLELVNDQQRVAIFHWPDYNGNPYNKIADNILAVLNEKKIDILVPNEDVEAEKVTCLTPRILEHAFDSDRVPDLKCRQAFIVKDETVSEDNKQLREENFKKTFQISAKWCGINDLQS